MSRRRVEVAADAPRPRAPLLEAVDGSAVQLGSEAGVDAVDRGGLRGGRDSSRPRRPARRRSVAGSSRRLHLAEETLVAIAVEEPDFDEFCRQIEYWEQRTDEIIGSAADEHERRLAGRRAHCSRTLDGSWKLDAVLDAVGGEEFSTALTRIERELFDADWSEARASHGADANHLHLARTPQQRRADALIEMARRATAMPVGARKPRPLITVVVGYETLNGPIRETFNRHVLSTHGIASLLTEADVERAVFDPAGRVIEVSKSARFFTGGLRRALEIRDRRCTHPGCDEAAEFCEGDHIIEHCSGGPTIQANGRLHCRHHNHQRPGRRKTPAPEGDDGDQE